MIVLNSLYRTKYSNPDELDSSSGTLALKTHSTSWVAAEEKAWLASAVGSPAHFMTTATGFGGACLVHCEMYGLPAYQVTVITESHYVTLESMQSFKPLLEKTGLPSAVETLHQRPNFRQIVQEANQRSNAIFS